MHYDREASSVDRPLIQVIRSIELNQVLYIHIPFTLSIMASPFRFANMAIDYDLDREADESI